jgi:hypothetical protein
MRRLKIIQMSIQSKVVYGFNAVLIQMPTIFFAEIKEVHKIHMESQGTPK